MTDPHLLDVPAVAFSAQPTAGDYMHTTTPSPAHDAAPAEVEPDEDDVPTLDGEFLVLGVNLFIVRSDDE